eukprot:scaffold161700_cov37-Prasinocladus_malaysianus.AAC.2
MLQDGSLAVMKGDGRLGCPAEAPFDCIHVGAAAHPLPDALVEQLKPDVANSTCISRPVSVVIEKHRQGIYLRTENINVGHWFNEPS